MIPYLTIEETDSRDKTGLPEPEFTEMNGGVSMTLFVQSLSTKAGENIREKASEKTSEKTSEKIINAIHLNPHITIAELFEALPGRPHMLGPRAEIRYSFVGNGIDPARLSLTCFAPAGPDYPALLELTQGPVQKSRIYTGDVLVVFQFFQ
jgi:hypothetical protein